uniref:Uncharacterized protein n=1 Tax=Zea mays TaxID=4577 RepID=B8A0H3_MAIZE|nr:unknown [Zea mays]
MMPYFPHELVTAPFFPKFFFPSFLFFLLSLSFSFSFLFLLSFSFFLRLLSSSSLSFLLLRRRLRLSSSESNSDSLSDSTLDPEYDDSDSDSDDEPELSLLLRRRRLCRRSFSFLRRFRHSLESSPEDSLSSSSRRLDLPRWSRFRLPFERSLHSASSDLLPLRAASSSSAPRPSRGDPEAGMASRT